MAIDGDLLKLVHLSNGISMVEGAQPLWVGDVCNAEAHITSVTNTDAGKVVIGSTMRVNHSLRDFMPSSIKTALPIMKTPLRPSTSLIMSLNSRTMQQSGYWNPRNWFDWDDEMKPLQAGTSLIFCVRSQLTFKDKTSYHNVSVSGNIFVCDQLKHLVKVGSIDFQEENFHGNPVVTYINITEIPRAVSPHSPYNPMDKDGNVKTLPLFGDINVRTPKYTFSHPSGLLFATQFAQIALVVTEKAAFEDMHLKGFVQKDCAFAGHSLGEYSALTSIADVLPISLVDVVFYHGITMQCAVEWDSKNRSNYAMCAVNSSRVFKTFSDAAL